MLSIEVNTFVNESWSGFHIKYQVLIWTNYYISVLFKMLKLLFFNKENSVKSVMSKCLCEKRLIMRASNQDVCKVNMYFDENQAIKTVGVLTHFFWQVLYYLVYS